MIRFIDWLEKHHQSKTEIWVQKYKKDTRRPSIAYDDLAEVCLCFGWTDGPGKSRRAEAQKRLDYLITMTGKGKCYGTQPMREEEGYIGITDGTDFYRFFNPQASVPSAMLFKISG